MENNIVLPAARFTGRRGKVAIPGCVSAMLAFAALAAASTVSFKAPQTYSIGAGPTSAAVADLNGDGNPDLAVLSYVSNNMTVLLGKGDGTYQSLGGFAAAISPNSLPPAVAIGDFNGDGKPDVAVLVPSPSLSSIPTEVQILLGNGDGTLRPPIVTKLELGETVAAVTDLNGDGKADLVVNLLDPSSSAPTGVAVLLGNGDGSFQSPNTVVTGQGFLTLVDFNGDNKPDLAVGASGTVQIFLGQGDGRFSPGDSTVLADGYVASKAIAADVNGDDIPDLVVISNLAIRTVCGTFIRFPCTIIKQHLSAFLGVKSGKLPGEQVSDSSYVGDSMASGDFDGDGKLDLAVGNQSVVNIYSGNGDGTFAPTVGMSGRLFMAADLNGDQLADLVILDPTNDNDVDLLLNATPAFHMTASTSTLTLSPGGEVTDDISLTTVNGFSSAIQLSCQVSGPAPVPTCMLSPQGLPAGTNSPTVTMTLIAPTQSKLAPTDFQRNARSFYAVGFAVAFLGFIPGSKRLDPRSKRWLAGTLLAALLLASIACGSGGSGPRPVPQQQYSVQVTAKSDALTRTLQVSVTAP